MKRNYKFKESDYDYPSRFGSHSSMINQELTERVLSKHPDTVILTDEYGDYVTVKGNIDSGLMDRNRQFGFTPTGSTSITKSNFIDRQEHIKSFLKKVKTKS